MKITILTICPELFGDFKNSHVIKRAESLGLLELSIVDIKDYAGGSFRNIDDSPFGGGKGLVLRCAPVLKALEAAKNSLPDSDCFAAAMTPAGIPYSQKTAHQLSGKEHLILICGHYEGFDERIMKHLDAEISIGDYVLTGGEIPAMAVADSVARLLKGNLKKGSAEDESFETGLLEYPQYTQPADYEGDKIPAVLLSGNHEKIRAWRKEQSLLRTKERRPDLYEAYLKRQM